MKISLPALFLSALAVGNGIPERTGCLTDVESDKLFQAYVATFDGVTDGGAVVNKSFTPDFALYSQSGWWTSAHGNGFHDIHKQADPVSWSSAAATSANARPNPANLVSQYHNYPPFAANRYQLIAENSGRGHNPNLITTGPLMRSCNGFAFYWQGDFNFNKTFGRVNGIDMVFVKPGACLIEKAYSEWNTLDLIYGSDGHVTFNPDLHACCDCFPGDPLCKCP